MTCSAVGRIEVIRKQQTPWKGRENVVTTSQSTGLSVQAPCSVESRASQRLAFRINSLQLVSELAHKEQFLFLFFIFKSPSQPRR